MTTAEMIQNIEKEEESAVHHGGIQEGRAKNVERDFVGVHNLALRKYFSGDQHLYNKKLLAQRFGCPREAVDQV